MVGESSQEYSQYTVINSAAAVKPGVQELMDTVHTPSTSRQRIVKCSVADCLALRETVTPSKSKKRVPQAKPKKKEPSTDIPPSTVSLEKSGDCSKRNLFCFTKHKKLRFNDKTNWYQVE